MPDSFLLLTFGGEQLMARRVRQIIQRIAVVLRIAEQITTASAKEACPVFPGAKQMLHWPFDDPAHAEGAANERRAVFRRVRGEIADQIQMYLAAEAASDLPG